MATEYVVDASAIAKLFLNEPDAEAFRDRWYQLLAGEATVIAPTLLRYEVGNLIGRNLRHLDAATRKRAWREALAGVTFEEGRLEKAFDISGLTLYDAVYVALAKTKKARLITFDDAMAKAASAVGVPVV